MPFLYFYYITSSFLTVLAMVVFVSSLFSCFLPVSRWGKTSSPIWRKILFFSWFFHLVMTWFSYCFSVTELTMQTVLPSDKSLAFYYLWNLVSKFVTTLSWKHRSVMTDGTNRDFFLSDAAAEFWGCYTDSAFSPSKGRAWLDEGWFEGRQL